MPLLIRLLCAVVALLVPAGCAPVSATSSPAPVGDAVRDTGGGVGVERPAVRASRLLREWDVRRAAAYSAGDPQGLRRLYAPGSRSGARDVRVLREYAERGLVVDGLTLQLLEARVLAETQEMVRLRVVDRVAGGSVRQVDRPRRSTDLPTGEPVTRVVTLVRGESGWVVRAVRRP